MRKVNIYDKTIAISDLIFIMKTVLVIHKQLQFLDFLPWADVTHILPSVERHERLVWRIKTVEKVHIAKKGIFNICTSLLIRLTTSGV